MIKLKSHLKESGKSTYKVFDDDEFIGYVVQQDRNWLYNPHPDITLKSVSFDSWTEMHEFLIYRNY